MNSNYKLVYSEALNTWVAVAEHVSARGKKSVLRMVTAAALMAGGVVGTGASLAAPPLITPPAVNQLPTGAQVTAGTVSFSQTQTATAASMAVQQSSNQAIVNWQSFNVGANAKVNITQPNASSVLLNRVQSSDPSQIFGQINANGQVLLLNPNGVYFAPGSRVDVGSFTASTHSISDADFLNGKHQFNRNGATGSILNEGHITSGLGGYIALLAPEVRNLGVVVAQMGGTVALAAGESYELQFGSKKQLTNVLVTPATLQTLVDNGQAVHAPGGLIILSAQAASGLLGGVVKNSGAISATGLVNDGGTIRLSASHKIELAPSSRISADAAPNSSGNGGRIDIITDLGNASGITQVDGTISAKGGEQGGDGGFIETSATHLKILDSARVSTLAPQGQAGNWLLDPNDFEVSSTGNISGLTLSTLLAGGNVTLQAGTGTDTSSARFGNVSTTGTKGDINIYDAVSWSANTLTLNAGYNINVGSTSATGSLTVTGSGSLNLNPSSSAVTGFTTGGAVLMGMAASPTSGLTGGYLSSGTFGAGAATGFNGQINVSTSGTVKISNTTYSVINSEAGFVGIASGGNYVMGSQLGFSTVYTAAVVASFGGKLNGFGHVISGLNINNASASGYIGLFASSNGNVSNLGLNGSIVGPSWVGAIAGYTNGLVISRIYSTVAVTGAGGVGGLVGLAQPVTISESYTTGDVTGSTSNADSIAGMVGFLYGGSITSSYTTGAIRGAGSSGGLVGAMQDGSHITNSFATGDVIASQSNKNSFGGLVGYVPNGSNKSITKSYATGAVRNNTGVTGTSSRGGLIGNLGSGTNFVIENNYWNVSANPSFDVSTGGTGNGTVLSGVSALTSSQLKSASNFSSTFGNTAGSFTAASGWGYQSGVNGGFPIRCGIIQCTAYDSSFYGLTFNGASNGLWSIASNWVFSGTSTVATFAPTSANAGTFSAVSVNAGAIVNYDTASVGSLGVPIANAGTIDFTGISNVSITGVISGNGSVTKSGTGTVTLSGANTYSGGTTVTAGTLKLGSATAAGSGAIGVSIGGALDLNGQTLTSTGALTLNSTGVANGGALVNSSSNAGTYAGAVTLASDSSYGGVGAITFGSTVNSASSAAYALSSTSAGNLVFNAAVGASYALSSLSTGTGTTTLGANVTTVGAQTYGGPVVIKNSSGVTLANTNSAITFGSTVNSLSATSYALTLSNGTGATTFTGAIGATEAIGALTVNGTGTITLGGNVTTKGDQNYAGPVSASAGIVINANSTTGTSGILTNGYINNANYAVAVQSAGPFPNEPGEYNIQNGTSNATIGTTGTIRGNAVGVLFYNTTNIEGADNGMASGSPSSSWCCYNVPYLVDVGRSTLLTKISVSQRAGDGQPNRLPTKVYVYGSNTPFTTSATMTIGYNNANISNVSVLGTGYQQSNFTEIGNGTLNPALTTSGTPALGSVSFTNTTAYRYYQIAFVSAGQTTVAGSYAQGLALQAINLVGSAYAPSSVTFNGAVTASGALTVNTAGFTAANMAAAGALTINNAGTGSVTGVISNNGSNAASLVKQGDGTLTLSRTNTYTGGTTVSAGTLQLGAGGATGSIEGNVTNNATLAFNHNAAVTYAGAISGTGAVTKLEANTLTFTGNNSYSGGTTISAGTLKAGSATALGTGAISMSNGAALDLNGQTMTSTGVLTLRGTGVSGTGALLNSGSTAATYAGALALGANSSIMSGASITSTISLTNTDALVGGGFTLTLGGVSTAGGDSFLYSVIDTTTTSVIKSGNAIAWNLYGANTYSGGTSINGGTLRAGSSTALGSGAITVASGGSFDLRGQTMTSLGTLSLNGTGISNLGALRNSSPTAATATYAGPLVLTGNTKIFANSGLIQLTHTGTITGATFGLTLGGAGGGSIAAIIGTTTGSLTKQDGGTWILSGANTYTGGTTVSAGTLQVGAGGTTGSISGNVSNTGVLDFNRSNDFTYAGAISGTGSVSKSGTGTLTLSGTSNFSGTTTVNSGTLAISNASGLGSTDAGTTVASGASLFLPAGVNVGAEAITLNGGTLRLQSGTTSLSGQVTLGAHSSVSVDSGAQLTLSGVVSGTDRVLTKTSLGTLVLTGANTYSGGTTINLGTLQLGAGGTTGSIQSNVTNNGTLSFNRSDDVTYAGAISGTGAVTKLAANTLTFTGTNTYAGGTTISAGTLQLGDGNTSGVIAGNVTNNATLAFNRSDALNFSGAISGTGAVSKLGTGTATLSGTNTYTGLTTVSTGTLVIGNADGLGGTAAGTTVANGATLDLQGVAVGAEAITLQGGNLATTTGTSSLSGAVTLGADSTINVAGSASELTISGLVTGARALTKSGTGKLIMSRQNTFSGGLTIASGTATEGTTYNGTSGPFGSGTVTVQSGATLDLNNYNVYAPVVLAGGALVNNATSGGTGQGDVSQGVSLTADSIFGGAGYMNAFTAITSNGYGLVFLGTGRKNLSNVSNTLSTIATGSGVGVLNVVNNQALTIGQVTAGGSTYSGIDTTGTVSVMTRTGNLTVSQNVVTTSTATSYTTPALKLGAGSDTAAGTPTGGDVVLSGTPTVSVGTGGVALIYSGYATTSAARTLNGSFAPKLTYYSINAGSSYVPTSFAAAYFTLFRESPATLYTLYLPNQRFTYGTPITSLNYCYSTSASSCSPVSVTGVPSTTQVVAANGAVPDVGSYALQIAPPAPDVTGYFFSAGNAVNIYVDPKPVTIANTAQTTTYNGLSTYSNLANAMTYTVNGLVGFDAVRSLTQTPSGSGLVASNVANAGSFTVTPGSVVLSTGKASNYTFSYSAATATVNKADLTVKANNDTKFIGEADVSGYNGVSYSGFVAGQTASVLSGSATVARSNAGVGAAGTYAGVLSAAGSTLSSNNYNLIYEAGSYTIVPADQLLIRLNDASTTYGTAPSYSLASVQYKSSTGNAVVDLTSRAAVNTAAFTLSDGAGGNTALTLGPVAASLSSAGQVAAGSYQVGASSVTNTSANYGNTVNIVGALTVEQKTLTPAATSGLSKVYDGTDSMGSLGFGLTGLVGADAVRATGVGTYANANAGTAKAFTVAGIGLAGTDAANYKLAANTLSATNGVVTTAPLLIKANNDSKTYDASAYAATAGVSYSGFVNGETAADLGGTLAYSGTAIGAVNVGNYVITPSGQTSSNYAISIGDGSLYISPADVRVSATNVALTGTVGKEYDGTNVATLSSGNYVITGWQGSDGANITQTTGTYDNANAGTNKLVSVTLAGSDFSPTNGTLLSNYNLPTAVSGNVGVISPKTVTVTNTSRNNTYDGSSYAALALGTTYSVGALVGLDAVASITQTPSGFSGAASGAANAGTFNVTPSAAVLSTGADSNYNFSYVQSTHTVNQAPLSVTLTGTTSKVYDGNTAATVAAGNFVLTGFVNAEGANVSQTTGTFDNANPGTGKTVLAALSSSDFAANSDTLLSNYILPTSASGSIGTITPAPVVPSTPATIQPVVFTPVVISSAVQSSAPPSLMVSAVISSASPASSSAVGSGLAGGSSSGVVVSTISSASLQVPGLVAVLVPAGTATSGTGLVIALPEQVVSSAAAGAAVQVTLSNNEPLPDWIRYDAATQTLVTSAVPAGAFPLSVLVTVGGQSTVVQISESQSNQ